MVQQPPRHGQERDRRSEVAHGPAAEYVDAAGNTVYRGPSSSVERTVTERWCATCRAWVTCRGILAQVLCPCCRTGWRD